MLLAPSEKIKSSNGGRIRAGRASILYHRSWPSRADSECRPVLKIRKRHTCTMQADPETCKQDDIDHAVEILTTGGGSAASALKFLHSCMKFNGRHLEFGSRAMQELFVS